MPQSFDIIVVGGGHAGTEAAAAAARMGVRVALVSMRRDMIGAMSCNPAIGGLGKGHLVREVDACDGLIARAADHGAIHYRMLNASKGAAVQGRAFEADRRRYPGGDTSAPCWRTDLEIVEGEAASLILEGDDGRRVGGLVLADGRRLSAGAVVLRYRYLSQRSPSFRNAQRCRRPGRGEARVGRLADQLRALALPIARLKTGTPPRSTAAPSTGLLSNVRSPMSTRWTMSSLEPRACRAATFLRDQPNDRRDPCGDSRRA